MRKREFLSKLLALFVTVTVALPNSALALRPMLNKTGLEEALAPQAIPFFAAGMEEQMLKKLKPYAANILKAIEPLEKLARQGNPEDPEFEKEYHLLSDKVLQAQLVFLQEAGLLNEVAYPLSGVDMRTFSTSKKILTLDYKVDSSELRQAAKEFKGYFGSLPPINLEHVESSDQLLENRGWEVLGDFLDKARSSGRHPSLLLKSFSVYYRSRYVDRLRRYLSKREPRRTMPFDKEGVRRIPWFAYFYLDRVLKQGDSVVLFGELEELVPVLLKNGYSHYFNSPLQEILDKANRRLAKANRIARERISSQEKNDLDHFYLVENHRYFAGGISLSLGNDLSILRKDPSSSALDSVTLPTLSGNRPFRPLDWAYGDFGSFNLWRLENGKRRISPLGGLEEAALAEVMADPVVRAGLEQQRWAPVPGGYIAEVGLTSDVPLLLQTGLEKPTGLPKGIPVMIVDETTLVGMIGFLKKQALQGRFNVAFSAEHFDLNDAQAAMPLTHPMPGSVLMDSGVRVMAQELSAAFVISQQTGTIYVIRITQLTSPSWRKPLLYIQVQT